MEMTILGQTIELQQKDFKLNKLSDKFGKMTFLSYVERTYNKDKANEMDCYVLTVDVEVGKPIDVRILKTLENLKLLEKLEKYTPIEFEDGLISTRAQGNGDFAQAVYTIMANKFIVLGKNNQPNK